mmetsp:Transcript_10610/g.32458  ORF Transcript_10610/g.32458 Transcript_10610/m.32458 type:complete len:202 (+) Transcript_10610:1142-1747(+)
MFPTPSVARVGQSRPITPGRGRASSTSTLGLDCTTFPSPRRTEMPPSAQSLTDASSYSPSSTTPARICPPFSTFSTFRTCQLRTSSAPRLTTPSCPTSSSVNRIRFNATAPPALPPHLCTCRRTEFGTCALSKPSLLRRPTQFPTDTNPADPPSATVIVTVLLQQPVLKRTATLSDTSIEAPSEVDLPTKVLTLWLAYRNT